MLLLRLPSRSRCGAHCIQGLQCRWANAFHFHHVGRAGFCGEWIAFFAHFRLENLGQQFGIGRNLRPVSIGRVAVGIDGRQLAHVHPRLGRRLLQALASAALIDIAVGDIAHFRSGELRDNLFAEFVFNLRKALAASRRDADHMNQRIADGRLQWLTHAILRQ